MVRPVAFLVHLGDIDDLGARQRTLRFVHLWVCIGDGLDRLPLLETQSARSAQQAPWVEARVLVERDFGGAAARTDHISTTATVMATEPYRKCSLADGTLLGSGVGLPVSHGWWSTHWSQAVLQLLHCRLSDAVAADILMN